MAREGLSTVEFLLTNLKDSNIRITDTKSLDELNPKWTSLIEDNTNLSRIETDQVKNKKFDVVFKTPGIAESFLRDSYGLKLTKGQLLSNTQLFFDLIHSLEPKPLTIGITGTKGKSTTTSQVFHVLKEAGVNVSLGGNIGVPPLKLLEGNSKPSEKTYVLEMSSHQLAELTTSPQIAVIQDISPDHLDYYPDFEAYFEAKTAICKFQQKSDSVIYNNDSKTASKISKLSPGEKISYSLDKNDAKSQEIIKLIENSPSSLVGEHNLYNTIPAVIIARRLDISNEKISKGIASFKSVPHRIELVKTVNKVNFYNDSAASAPEATIAALKSFKNKSITLIVGGSEKGANFDNLAQAIINHDVKFLILFPSTGDKIIESIKEINQDHPLIKNNLPANSMEKAVTLSQKHSKPGDVVLLSPASASFNMFKNYEDRGNQFKKLVNHL